MWESVKKRLASVNITLMILLGFFAVHRGIDPCDRIVSALIGGPIADIGVDVEEPVTEGPPLASQLVVVLDDGRVLKVLKNGAVTMEEPGEEKR